MMKRDLASIAVLCLVVVLVAGVLQDAAAVNCSPLELTSCYGAISGSGAPSAQCCAKLKEQVPCLCGYIRNPQLRPYIQSPNANKVAAACGVTIPTR